MPLLHQINPVALHIGPLQVHWYGLMYLLAFALAWWLGRRRIRAGFLPGVSEAGFGDLMFYGMLGVILGGRIGYILFYDLGTYLKHPLQVFEVWNGGMSFHGGLVGVMLAMWYWARKQGMHFFDVADFVAPLVPPGLGFGRIGNFINGELWGRVADPSLPWAMVFPRVDAVPRHPSQLYEVLLEGVLLFVLLWAYARRGPAAGALSGAFLVGYGVFRFVVETFREPDDFLGLLGLGLSMGQWLCLPMIAGGAALWWWARRRGRAASGGVAGG